MGDDHDHRNMAPTVPLMLAGGLVLLTLLGVTYQQLVVNPNARERAPRTLVQERLLAFDDLRDGTVVVRDGRAGEPLGQIAPGKGNFLRGTLRGLVRERRIKDAAMAPGFAIRQFTDGSVVVVDLSTGSEVDLRAFGALNAKEFTRYLPRQYAAERGDTRLAER